MSSSIFGYVAIACYLTSSMLLTREIKLKKSFKYSIAPSWLAICFHLAFTFNQLISYSYLDAGFFSISSITTLIIALLLVFVSLSKPIEKLGIVLFPLTSLVLFLAIQYSDSSQLLRHESWQMNLHIFSSIIAFSLLNIAAIQAIFLAIQDQQLRKHPPSSFIMTLPPLQSMESLLFQMITTGVIFLTVSLTTGGLFVNDIFAQHLSHKTVLSIFAWIIFSSLLFGRIRYGWRGQSAIQWTLIGFTSLLLAYFGSKLVLELILQR